MCVCMHTCIQIWMGREGKMDLPGLSRELNMMERHAIEFTKN